MFGSMGQSVIKNLGNGGEMDGDVTITGDLTVGGGISLSVDEVIQGTSTIDVDSTTALVVRKNGASGDVLIVDTDNSRVGIGVTPLHNLTVNNQIGIKRDGTDAYGTLTFDSSGFVIDQSASGYAPLKIKSNGTEVARFTSTGLGIGTSSPSSKLHVRETAGDEFFTFANGNGIGLVNNVASHGIGISASQSGSYGGQGSSALIVTEGGGSANAGTVQLVHDGTIGFTYKGGNVGIGRIPTQKLDIYASSGNQTIMNELGGAGNAELRLKNNAGDRIIRASADKLQFIDNADSRADLTIDGSGNVGIGTTSPDYKLKVEESTNGADCAIAIRALNDGGAGRTALLRVDPDAQTFTLGSANIVADISNERIGIGTTAPERKLHVVGNPILIDNNQHYEGKDSGGAKRRVIGLDSSNNINIGSGQSGGSINFIEGDTTHMSIDASGKVGIGTSSVNGVFTAFGTPMTAIGAQTVADIFGNTQQDADKGGGIGLGGRYITDSSSVTAFAEISGVKANNTNTNYEGEMVFKTRVNGGNLTERMRIDGSGNVGIGRSTNIDKKLHILSSTSGDGITLEQSSVGSNAIRFEANSSALRGLFGSEDSDGGAILSGTSGYSMVLRSEADIFLATNGNNEALKLDTNQNARFAGDVTTGGTLNVTGASSATATLNINANNGASTNNKVRFLKETGAEFKLQMNTGGVSSFANLVNFTGTGTTFNNPITSNGLLSNTSSTYDIGSSSNLWRDAYLKNGGRVYFGDTGTYVYGSSSLDILSFAVGTNERFKLDVNSRISLGNNDSSGGTTNTIFGRLAGNQIASGSAHNTAIGSSALDGLTTGTHNTAIGSDAMGSADGAETENTVVGYRAGFNINNGTGNVCIGAGTNLSAVNGQGQIAIGKDVSCIANETATIGFGSNVASLGLDGSDTSWAASSDERLKENIVDSTAGLDVINDLRPVTYNWKKAKDIDKSMPQYKDSDEPVLGKEYGESLHGFIAQEVKVVIDKHDSLKKGFKMWKQSDDGTQTIADGNLIPILVKAVQELSAKVKELESK